MENKDFLKYGISIAAAAALPASVPVAVAVKISEIIFHIIIDSVPSKKLEKKLETQLKKSIDNAKKSASSKMKDSERGRALIWHLNQDVFGKSANVSELIDKALRYLDEKPSLEDIIEAEEIFEECIKEEIIKYPELFAVITIKQISDISRTTKEHDSTLKEHEEKLITIEDRVNDLENQESPQVFDANWFTNKLESSIANLRGRFSAELNIPVEQEIILEYLVSPEYYRSSVKVLSCAVQESIKKVKPNYTEISADIRCDENSMRCFLEKLILECENAIIDSEAESSISLRSAKRIFGEYISELKKTKEYAAVLSAPMVLITGTAGIGKSHFIAHCAKKHIEKGGAGVLILGNLLNESYPLCTQIMNCLNIKCIDGFLSDLNTLGAKFGKRSIIFIDALNEAASGV